MTQVLSEMLLMVMLGILMIGIRWSRLGAPAWLTERRTVLLADLHAVWIWFIAVPAKAGHDAFVAWSSTPVRFRAPVVAIEDRDFSGSDAPTIRIKIGARTMLEAARSETDHHRRHGTVRFEAWRIAAIAQHYHGMNEHTAWLKARARKLPQVVETVAREAESIYYPRLHAVPADSPATFSLERMLAAVR